MENIKFIDLFCGIGGFHVAMKQACEENGLTADCVFSSDIDTFCQDSYQANFGRRPVGDITKVNEEDIPDHDVLFAGFKIFKSHFNPSQTTALSYTHTTLVRVVTLEGSISTLSFSTPSVAIVSMGEGILMGLG